MAQNTKKNAILHALINDAIVDIFVKSGVENIVYETTAEGTEVTLATKLAEIIATLGTKASTSEMNTAISTAISELIGGAPETYDTLKEIADYIAAHEDVVTALNQAIGSKADKATFEATKATVDSLKALAFKDKVAEADLDDALKAKVNAASTAQHTHDNKAELDKIADGDKAKWDQAATDAAAVKADYLKSTDKTELQGNIDTVSGKVDTLVGADTGKSARTISAEEVAKIVAGADESFDTLKEIADWISSHKTDATAMNSAITKLEGILAGIGGDGEKATVVAYVTDAIAALKIGDYAKAADLTALAGRVEALEAKAHEHANKTVLDGISAEDVAAWNGKSRVIYSATQPNDLAAGDLWVQLLD